MRTFDEWCKFFSDIDRNPRAIISGLTLRNIRFMREHVNTCLNCNDIVARTIAKSPPRPLYSEINFN